MIKSRLRFVSGIIMFLLTFSINSSSFANISIPEFIRIGLHYDSTATSLVNLSSNHGFRISRLNGTTLTTLLDISGETNLRVKKNAYYINNNGNYVEYNPSNPPANNSNLEGPHHVKIGNNFNNITDAINLRNALNSSGLNSYVFFDGQFKVYLGNFISSQDAQRRIDELRITHPSHNYELVNPSATSVEIVNNNGQRVFAYDSSIDICISNLSGNPIIVNDRSFRGSIIFKRFTGSDMTVINRVRLEEYLYGVVPREMPASWNVEALKAQAIAARNYAIRNINKHSTRGFDLCTTQHCQVYGGHSSENSNSNRAVDETRGQVIVYNGSLVEAYYHSHSGGRTENSENVWSAALPYLRGVNDPYSLRSASANNSWDVIRTKSDIESRLATHGRSVGSLQDIQITQLSSLGRPMTVTFIGSSGQSTASKDFIRTVLGLNSTMFTLNKETTQSMDNVQVWAGNLGTTRRINIKGASVISGDNKVRTINTNSQIHVRGASRSDTIQPDTIVTGYRFSGSGWGHGIGMSQWGAKVMADEGFNYEQILRHYYTGVQIIKP
ncbi:SpoIID/LytB domain-containing protein [Alkalithermobacter paradoxus]|uniref:Amidase enhancer n=1 Tax=Alkalithermobacter paradoxus TaxID=29349 RepID=A0A1V4I9U1_9FIRM|nr:amidase enhancer precursor [[Clostridium] thermoalcaliphilum]